MRTHERCWLLKTAGPWPWKPESAKECVTAHLPKQPALKMDGAVALGPYPTVRVIKRNRDTLTSKRVLAVASKGTDASQPGAAASTDLGGSSKYSSETLEDQCGEGFHVNSS
jgi:hypothetical protein